MCCFLCISANDEQRNSTHTHTHTCAEALAAGQCVLSVANATGAHGPFLFEGGRRRDAADNRRSAAAAAARRFLAARSHIQVPQIFPCECANHAERVVRHARDDLIDHEADAIVNVDCVSALGGHANTNGRGREATGLARGSTGRRRRRPCDGAHAMQDGVARVAVAPLSPCPKEAAQQEGCHRDSAALDVSGKTGWAAKGKRGRGVARVLSCRVALYLLLAFEARHVAVELHEGDVPLDDEHHHRANADKDTELHGRGEGERQRCIKRV